MGKILWPSAFILSFLLHFFPPVSVSAKEVSGFPNVDLGYAVHAATSVDVTQSGIKLGNYNNIRFAQPPTGNLRFRKPVTPPPKQSGVQNGDMDPTPDCVSSTSPQVPLPGISGQHSGTEDCLFLNVQVPEGAKPGDKLPVIHFIHGGGYTFGSKDLFHTGLYSTGLLNGTSANERFIFVSHNYRLGLYGWASSPFENNMDANIGIYDSVAALEWTKRYIDRFGGDPDRITAFGQDAGAGIITAMLTSNGGRGELPFSKAILSSPNFVPRRRVLSRRQQVYEEILKAANCPTLSCLKGLSADELRDVNHKLVTEGRNDGGGGTFGPGIGFGPVVDGSYVPDAPQVLLQRGSFHKEVQSVISSNTLNEGMGMISDGMPEKFSALVRTVFPGASDTTVRRIQDLFHLQASDPAEKLGWDWITSVVFACNSWGISQAYAKVGGGRGKARRYLFSAPPALHGSDMSYLFYVDQETTSVHDPHIALQVQSYIRKFLSAKDAELPIPPGSPDWPLYGQAADIMNMREAGLEITRDPWDAKDICKTLMDITLDPENGA
ncbi:hypothetical protein EMCG_04829 [[Emmonsia] crescens]|uniref:Carboxylesterase type B domain-containing protein n=1 Tax=[Emmonsia] crescens TaxID=73230 RepID=A0A0G2HS27_9EURO|nr:hypothetical protein EMCG_04829 [Emmonsia crescens UAMH 3008]